MKNCLTCSKPLAAERIARFPFAVLCGKDACTVVHRKAQEKVKQSRWRAKRVAADPGFRLRALAGCRRRYVARRLAAGKKVGPPAAWAHRSPPADPFLSAIRRSAAGALRRAARAVMAFCGVAI